MRDAGGKEFANLITDTGYDMHEQVLIRRRILLAHIRIDIRENGYTTKDKVVSECYEKGKNAINIFGSLARWKETLNSYLPQLKKEQGLKVGRPTNEEKERWGLAGDGWIIRYK